MLRKVRQVCLTYLTWRWIWFIWGVTLIFVGVGLASNNSRPNFSNYTAALGMPVFLGFAFLVAIVKWQFAHPRARLMPSYKTPHLFVFGAILFALLVANPLLLSYRGGISIAGSLAFTLLLGGSYLWGVGFDRGWMALPCMAIFFSPYIPAGNHFWFSDEQPYRLAHTGLVIVGLTLAIGWLWRIAHLDEEMSDYQTNINIGWLRHSRLESAELRKYEGRRAARKGLGSWFADRWHDRLPWPVLVPSEKKPSLKRPSSKTKLLRYGFTSISPAQQALGVTCFVVLFTMMMFQFKSWQKNPSLSVVAMPFFSVMVIPAGATLLQFARRRSRMAHELLYPLTRTEYIDGLLRAAGRQFLFLWIATQVTLGIVVKIGTTHLVEMTFPALISYAFFSAATQLVGFGCILWLARFSNGFVYIVGIYFVVGIQALLFATWRNPSPLGTFLLGLALALGVALIVHSRRLWLETELG
jgi:hypothetical protein